MANARWQMKFREYLTKGRVRRESRVRERGPGMEWEWRQPSSLVGFLGYYIGERGLGSTKRNK